MGRRPRLHRWAVLAGVTAAATMTGCGPALYTVHVAPAARVLRQAEEAGAANSAPYEYFYARAHLAQAREDAGEAAYQDAIRNAAIAEEYAVKARDRARERGR